MRKTPAFAVAALLLSPPALLAAGGSSAPSTSLPSTQLSPEQGATASYNKGLKQRDKAWKLEEEAEAAEGKARDKLLKKAQKAYGKAVRELRAAVDVKPDYYQAWSSLGYALRKTGEFDESIAAYDRALELNPLYPEAIEYRGEAYLGLGRLEDAKEAYMELFRIDRPRAGELMTAMKRWLESGGGAVSESVREEFARWVEERSNLAAQVGRVAGARSW